MSYRFRKKNIKVKCILIGAGLGRVKKFGCFVRQKGKDTIFWGLNRKAVQTSHTLVSSKQ